MTNLAGIARTCEIFAVQELVLASLAVVKSDDFQGISVSCETWLPMRFRLQFLFSLRSLPSCSLSSSLSLSPPFSHTRTLSLSLPQSLLVVSPRPFYPSCPSIFFLLFSFLFYYDNCCIHVCSLLFSEVPVASLSEYLRKMRRSGYAIIGLEQTDSSMVK